jgi:hypothetical protein
LYLPVRATWSITLLDLIAQKYLVKCTSYETAHYRSLLQSPASCCLLGPNILITTPFSDTFSLCSSISMRNPVLHR